MTFASDTDTQAFARPESLLRVPVGLASPLWGLFAGAAMTGAAWWWMTRWTRPQNLEALFGATSEAVEAPSPVVAEVVPGAPASAGLDTATLAAEAALDAVADASGAVIGATEQAMEAAEAVPEIVGTSDTVAAALVEAPAIDEPVGGEAAPISPVLAAVNPDRPVAETPAPKARKKSSAPPPSDSAAD